MSKNDDGFIYILEKDPFIIKIGYSKYSPQKRSKELSSKFSKFLCIKGHIFIKNAFDHEQYIHTLLSSYRVQGEWYLLTYLDAKKILEDKYKFIDGVPELTLEKNKIIKSLILRIPTNLLNLIDNTVQAKFGFNRHMWILQAIQEKLER